MKIILGNAPIKNGNRGCVALTITIACMIDEIMKKAGLSYELYLSDSQYDDRKTHEILIDDRKIEFKDCRYPIGISLKNTIGTIIKNIVKGSDLNIFFKADYILDIGQGDSFSDIYGFTRFNSIDRIHRIAHFLHIPYCILPQTIGPFKNYKVEHRAIKSISNASYCMARDKQSYDYVVGKIPSLKSVKEYIDVAFFLPYHKIEQDTSFIHVGINISALLWHGGYTRNNQFELKCNYKNLVTEIIDYFLGIENVQVHLIPHVVGAERTIENDYGVSYDLWRQYNNSKLKLAPLALGPVEIKSYIAGMDFFVGARMHATIGAFSSRVPVVPMAYSRKFNGLFIDTLDYPYICDMRESDHAEIISTIRESFHSRLQLKELIDDRMNHVVSEKKDMLMNNLTEFFNIRK